MHDEGPLKVVSVAGTPLPGYAEYDRLQCWSSEDPRCMMQLLVKTLSWHLVFQATWDPITSAFSSHYTELMGCKYKTARLCLRSSVPVSLHNRADDTASCLVFSPLEGHSRTQHLWRPILIQSRLTKCWNGGSCHGNQVSCFQFRFVAGVSFYFSKSVSHLGKAWI